MKMRFAGGLLLSTLTLPALALAASQSSCNRDCLEGYVNRYLDAMQAHKASDELFARDTKFTENGVRLPLGNEGLWFRMSGKGTYKFYVPDVEAQQVAFIGTVREGGKTATDGALVALALRLKIVNDRITEVEQLAIRPDVPLGGAAPAPSRFPPTGEAVEKMGAPNPIFKEVIPEAKRPSREELIKTANYYFAGLQRNDGKGYYPFTDDCDRFENGQIRRIEAVFHRAPYGINSGWSTYEQGMSEEPQIIR